MKTPILKTGAARGRMALLASLILLPSSFCLTARGQSYSINWHKIGGGGGSSSGTNAGTIFSVSGTIGQQDAGGSMSGASFSLTGGFWSFISVVQTTGAPVLAIAHSGNSVTVSWPNTGNYTLQQNNNLAAPAGWAASGYQITTANGTNSITILPANGNLFFRLAAP
jgi:hypothetical protein